MFKTENFLKNPEILGKFPDNAKNLRPSFARQYGGISQKFSQGGGGFGPLAHFCIKH